MVIWLLSINNFAMLKTYGLNKGGLLKVFFLTSATNGLKSFYLNELQRFKLAN